MRGEDPLHDARNLMSALGLYCDLLAMPGVLQPQHRKYAEDMRLVGTRSDALIGRLIQQLTRPAAEGPGPQNHGPEDTGPAPNGYAVPQPVSLPDSARSLRRASAPAAGRQVSC